MRLLRLLVTMVIFLLKPASRRPERLFRLAIISAQGGEAQVLTEAFDRQVDEGSLRWSADGSSIVFSAASEGSRGLWRVRPGDEPEAGAQQANWKLAGYDMAVDGEYRLRAQRARLTPRPCTGWTLRTEL